jgi:ATP-dependent DNA helicase UvrD/PcrA
LAHERDLELEKEKEEEERLRGKRRKAEMRATSISLAAGDSVVHDKFGRGTVVSTSGAGAHDDVTIDFGEGFGVKILLLGYAPLRKI